MGPLQKVHTFNFQRFLPLTPKGKTLKIKRMKKSSLGDLGVFQLFGVVSFIYPLEFLSFFLQVC
jgi:hypothetical protein